MLGGMVAYIILGVASVRLPSFFFTGTDTEPKVIGLDNTTTATDTGKSVYRVAGRLWFPNQLSREGGRFDSKSEFEERKEEDNLFHLCGSSVTTTTFVL